MPRGTAFVAHAGRRKQDRAYVRRYHQVATAVSLVRALASFLSVTHPPLHRRATTAFFNVADALGRLWPTRYSRYLGACIDVSTTGASIDVTNDSSSDEKVGGDFHAERSIDTSAMCSVADGAPPAAAADGFVNIGVDISVGCDGYEEAETICWGAGSGGKDLSLKGEVVVVAAPRANLTRREGRLRRDVLTRRAESPSPPVPDDVTDGTNGDAVGSAPTGGGAACGASSPPSNKGSALGSSDGADGADDASVTVDKPEHVRLRAILEVREAELAQLKGVDHELVRLRDLLEVREAELAQLKGIDHRNEEAF